MVPRVAMLTTDGEMRLTMGASDGIGASATAAGRAAIAGEIDQAAAMTAAAKPAAAILRRKFMRVL
jgi:hypothetical protein